MSYNEEIIKKKPSDWKQAKSVLPDKGEVDKIISGKMVERVQMQKNYQQTYLQRRVKEERLKHFRRLINEKKETTDEDGKKRDYSNVEFVFNGDSMSLSWAMTEFNLERFYLKTMLSNEQYLRQGLKNVGFTDIQLEDIIMYGKYVTEDKTLKDMEKVEEKRRLKKKK